MPDITARLSTALADRYQIESRLGEGGMATVYLAEDLKHKRKVAIKVLRAELAAVLGAERFVQEITTTANLQHPHILPLFDSGEADSFLYYVMPFIDGETLREKLDRETQLSIEEAVKITTEVADALHYAHGEGVIHRDIKPENILIHNSRPMVADFGIALAVSAAAGGRMTETGLSLGTPHYMSPEQATAEKEITARSDVYSLGAMLYEMLTGDPPHTGSSAQQIIMKIVTDEARPVAELRKSVPPHVAAATAKALEKLPADRFDSAKAFAEALANASFTIPSMGAMTGTGPGPADWRQRAAVPALIVAALLLVTTLWSLTRPAPPVAVARYEVAFPEAQGLSANVWSRFAISPDGSRFAYLGPNGTILLRARNQLNATELTGTEGAFNPFFSRDGTRVGFMDGAAGNAQIKTVGIVGGSPVLVTDSSVGGPGATWGYDGFIYYDASGVGPLRRVSENGGVSETVSTLDSAGGELQHIWPDALPNGRGIIMTLSHGGPGQQGGDADDVAVLDLSTGQHTVLARGVFGRYATSGHLLYVTADGVLMAAPFDQDRLEVTGESVALIPGVGIRSGGGGVDLAISDGGTLWYGAGQAFGLEREVMWATREGVMTPVDPDWTDNIGDIALSPTGDRLAAAINRDDGRHIWVKELETGPLTKLTFEGDNREPSWHPDGESVIFSTTSAQAGTRALFSVRADGGALARSLIAGDLSIRAGRWSDDGTWVIYHTDRPDQDVYGFRPDSDSASTPLLMGDFVEMDASVSPDGNWLVFVSEQTGRAEVYVRPFPDTEGPMRLISSNGGLQPHWSRSGRSIFYRSFESDLIEVDVILGKTVQFGESRVLFNMGPVGDWDVTNDGQRFIVVSDRSAYQSRGNLIVVENFFEELKERVGN